MHLEVLGQNPVNQAPLWLEGLLQDSWVWHWKDPVGNLNMDLEGHKVLRMSLGLFHKA